MGKWLLSLTLVLNLKKKMMLFDDVLKNPGFSHRSQGLPLEENWPLLVVGHSECEHRFHKSLFLVGLVGTGWECD